jgi:glucosylceramidase
MSANVQVWFSSEDGNTYRLSRQNELAFSNFTDGRLTTVRVDPTVKYQRILGMGASVEEASVYNLSRMDEDLVDSILRSLIDPIEGIGWNLMRICFGSSDFTARPYYSYDDLQAGQTDTDLVHFSIQKDIDYGIIPTIKKILIINPDMKIFASPWSPPGWMKSNGSMCGGYLLPEYYQVAARYYRMAIQAYEDLGVPIYALTLQNEPLMVSRHYPTCKFTWEQQLRFLKTIKVEFATHEIQAKLWIFDHNFNNSMRYPAKILVDPCGYAATDGIAFHAYEGKPPQMSDLHNSFPKKDIYFTEYSTWGTKGIDAILQYFRNWACSYNAWVFCLDNKRQPNAGPHPADPTFVTVDSKDPNRYNYIPEYYLLGQLTKFVQPGAHRIYSDYGSRKSITNAAFLNPDGIIILVDCNQNRQDRKFVVEISGQFFTPKIPANTVATFLLDKR